eukprot:TRINITY_DN26084_c1_g1_i1.p1 TRINITY_DN26084_c1_g1~~TRINITY_DN26084_c1_g1_i1.p1  ORF type:complete len:324 (+),score=31.61 TRINITY_DN26084_c1_g1_i1:3-974(+)
MNKIMPILVLCCILGLGSTASLYPNEVMEMGQNFWVGYSWSTFGYNWNLCYSYTVSAFDAIYNITQGDYTFWNMYYLFLSNVHVASDCYRSVKVGINMLNQFYDVWIKWNFNYDMATYAIGNLPAMAQMVFKLAKDFENLSGDNKWVTIGLDMGVLAYVADNVFITTEPNMYFYTQKETQLSGFWEGFYNGLVSWGQILFTRWMYCAYDIKNIVTDLQSGNINGYWYLGALSDCIVDIYLEYKGHFGPFVYSFYRIWNTLTNPKALLNQLMSDYGALAQYAARIFVGFQQKNYFIIGTYAGKAILEIIFDTQGRVGQTLYQSI